MSETRRWLLTRRRELVTAHALGGALASGGVLLLALGVGVLLARVGLYRQVPATVLLAWAVVLGAAVASVLPLARRLRAFRVERLARTIERDGHRRAGWVAGAASWVDASERGALARLADSQVAAWLSTDGGVALQAPRRGARRAVQGGAAVFVAGVAALAAIGPASAGGRDFWRPLEVVSRSRGPVRVTADRAVVPRGESVLVSVVARGRRAAELLTRAPGEEWHRAPLALDTAGTASVVLGPLDGDRFVRAVSGGRESETVRIAVALPVLVTALELTARYPVYLDRPDELLAADADTLWLPRGTTLRARGTATVPLGDAAWISQADTVRLSADGVDFTGDLAIRADGRWTLSVRSAEGASAAPPLPMLTVVAVPDSVPTVLVPVPGADTVASVSLQQGLLIDAHDDYRIRTLELRSWRVTRRGEREEPVVEPIELPDGGAARVVLPWLLDLNDRGFVPGDTAFYQVAATDNAPNPHVGSSRVYSLRLPAMSELREAIRDATRTTATGADSLVAAQQDLARRVEDLAAERERAGAATDRTSAGEQLPFDAAERTREVLDEQERLAQRADSLRAEIRQLAQDAWAAGLTDPAFQQQLREIQDLLDRAMTDDLAAALSSLRRALDRLDAGDVEDALRRLAEAANRLRDDLTRSRELFQRAAVEGELTTLSGDADELAQGQREWNARVERTDSAAAAADERVLAESAERLTGDLDRLAGTVDSLGMAPDGVRRGAESSRAAAEAMRQAQVLASQGRPAEAKAAGERASGELDPLGASLRQERDDMRESWRAEVLAQLDRALVETAGLAERQSEIADRVRRGDAGPDVRGEQAAVREGVDRVGQRLQAAAGRNALVPKELGAALGLAMLRMEESLASLTQAAPSAADAADLAGEAVDALNAVVYAMLQSRGDVSSAESGSGLSEALERMAQLAQQQGAMNGEAGSLFPLMQAGGDEVMQRLQALAAQQRALAQELERMRAQGQIGAAGELAEQAQDVARDLAGGRLDRETLDRQEQLYRRLLDAGRSLQSDEEDQRKERVSETARPGNVRRPANDAVPTGASRYPYPAWEELRSLSPEQRRLILEYFRRLNRAP